MFEEIKTVDEQTKNIIYLAPVYATLWAANQDGVLEDKEMDVAINFMHIQTYNGPEYLRDYFKKVQVTFEDDLVKWNNKLPLGKHERDEELIRLMQPVRAFIDSIGEEKGSIFKRELTDFTKVIEKSNRSVLESSILPLFSGFLHKKGDPLDPEELL